MSSHNRRQMINRGSFNISMDEANKAGYAEGTPPPAQPAPSLPDLPPMNPRHLITTQLQQENSELRGELEELRQQLESRSSALSINDGTLTVHDLQFTPKGLIAAKDMDRDTWDQVGNLLFKLEGSIQWLIGDWLVHGIKLNYGDIPDIAKALGKDDKTLRNYMTVSRNIEMSRRRDNLSFGHHDAVSGLGPLKQARALDHATEHKMSVSALRKWVYETENGNQTVEVGQLSEYKITPAPQRSSIFRQYSRDIERFNADDAASLDELHTNDLYEVARRAEWLADHYKALAQVAKTKHRKSKK